MISHFGVLVDNGFGTFIFGELEAHATAVVPGGGFLVAGSIDDFYDSGRTFSDSLSRSTPSQAKLDSSFGGGDGWMQVNTGGRYSYANAMAVQPSGKILLGRRITAGRRRPGNGFRAARELTPTARSTILSARRREWRCDYRLESVDG